MRGGGSLGPHPSSGIQRVSTTPMGLYWVSESPRGREVEALWALKPVLGSGGGPWSVMRAPGRRTRSRRPRGLGSLPTFDSLRNPPGASLLQHDAGMEPRSRGRSKPSSIAWDTGTSWTMLARPCWVPPSQSAAGGVNGLLRAYRGVGKFPPVHCSPRDCWTLSTKRAAAPQPG